MTKAFVDVDQVHSVLGRQICVTTERANVVRMMNAPENNIVTVDNAKVPHGQSPNRRKYCLLSCEYKFELSSRKGKYLI